MIQGQRPTDIIAETQQRGCTGIRKENGTYKKLNESWINGNIKLETL